MIDCNLSECAPAIRKLTARLLDIREKITGVRIPPAPSYDVEGVESLHNALRAITSIISHTSSRHSDAVILMGTIRRLVHTANGLYQEEYDKRVASRPNNRAMSWEDQSSLIRVAMIDSTRHKRDVDDALIEAEAEFSAIEVLAQSRYRLRNDYSPLLDTLRVGNILSET